MNVVIALDEAHGKQMFIFCNGLKLSDKPIVVLEWDECPVVLAPAVN